MFVGRRIAAAAALLVLLLDSQSARADEASVSELRLSAPEPTKSLQGFVEKGPAEAFKPLYVPGLVPYADEVTVTGVADFDELEGSGLKEKCLLVESLCHDGNLGFYRGRVLFNCKNDLHVVTPDATVDVRRGSIVYLYSTGESMVILNLHDDHRRSVMAHVDGEEIEIPPGREVLITRYRDLSFDDARLCPGIWYRSVHELVSRPKLKVYLTQFSTISAAAIMPSVHKVVQKRDRTAEKLAKTFAAVITISRDRQRFRPCMQPKPALAEISPK